MITFKKISAFMLVGTVAVVGGTACKQETPTTAPTMPVEPRAGTPTGTMPTMDAGQAMAAMDGGAADPDLTVIAITAVDIDTRLAVMCGIPESQVFFKFDSAKLLPEAKERLEKIATCAKTGAAKGQDLLVVGRAGPVGSDEYNKQLGMSRADAVAKFLQDQGVKQARVETESKGEPETTPPPGLWPLERRVTVRLKP